MNTQTSKLTSALSLAALTLLVAACSPTDESNSTVEVAQSAPSEFVMTTEPTTTLSVSAARKQATPGETLTVRGQIGGTRNPFVDGFAGFVLSDSEILFCNESGDDHCTTPWDACCEDPDLLKAMRISVQFVDSESNPIQADLKATLGLAELDDVSVSGTVAETSTPTNVILHATKIYKH